MSGAEHVKIVRHFLDNFNAGDVPAALEAMDPNVRYEGPQVDGIWWANGPFQGVDALLHGIIEGVDDHFERLSVIIDHVYACGDDVVVISHHDGVTKAGVEFDSPLVQVYSVRDGKVVLLRDFADTDSWRTKVPS
jgi:ketosteroid isomerase-like protein